MFSDLQDIGSFNIEECAILLQYFKLSDAEKDAVFTRMEDLGIMELLGMDESDDEEEE